MHTRPINKGLFLVPTSLILGILHTYLFHDGLIGLNYPLFILYTIACGLWLLQVFGRTIQSAAYVILALAMFFGMMVFVRSSDLLTFFNILGSLLLLLIAIDLATGKQIGSYIVNDFLKVAVLPFRFIVPFFKTASEIVSLRNFSIQNTKTREIIRGILVAILATSLFAWLLAGADATFAKIFESLFDFELNETTIGRIIQTLFVTAFFLGAFAFMLRKSPENGDTRDIQIRNLGLIETSIPLIAINLLFFLFIMIQIGTLFGGQIHLTREGLTYAEYARNGFLQLIWVAIFSFLIVTFMERRVTVASTGHIQSFKIMSGILILQVVLILVSAFQRLSLYETAYGFTTIRLFSHALMIWLAGALILLLYHIWKNERQEVFSFRLFGTTIILLVAMNLINPDVFIAKKNLERYAETGNIDSTYLGNLSYDTLPYTIHLLNDEDYVTRRDYASALYFNPMYCLTGECEEGVTTWKSMRLNERNAQALLNEHSETIKSNSNYPDILID